MKNPMVDKLKWYIGAGFPILYIQTFEEGKADGIIADAAGKKGVYEWNGSDGLVNFKTKSLFARVSSHPHFPKSQIREYHHVVGQCDLSC